MEKLSLRFALFILCNSLVIPTRSCKNNTTCLKERVALFIFGDSILDVGNNNYINTTGRANYYPYGQTFFKYPTGRFSDGLLVPDFIAEYANLPFLPPYLQLHSHPFPYGVNFASAGAGALVETRLGSVIDLQSQVNYFKNVRRQLRKKLGDSEARSLLSRAVYLFSVGGNDYSFKDGKKACCGSGPYRGIFSCGGKRGVKDYEVCEDVKDFVFFDSSHLTEKAYQQLAIQAWSGNSNFTGPYNLKALFESQ